MVNNEQDGTVQRFEESALGQTSACNCFGSCFQNSHKTEVVLPKATTGLPDGLVSAHYAPYRKYNKLDELVPVGPIIRVHLIEDHVSWIKAKKLLGRLQH